MAIKNPRRAKQLIQSVARLVVGRTFQPTVSDRAHYKVSTANITTLPTGFRTLDKAIGLDGLPYGHLIELSSAVTTAVGGGANNLAARIGAKVQRQQQIVTIVDLCQNFDLWQAEQCGLVAPELLLTRPDTLFSAITTLENATRAGGLIILNLGNVPELLTNVDAGSLNMLLRRLKRITRSKNSIFLLLTNSIDNDPFNPKSYPPGFPLADLADIRLWLQDETWSYNNGFATAYKANLTVVKNRFGLPGTGANIRIKFTPTESQTPPK
ncbi:MAG: hypothetical protein AAF485_19230 [Chloroflexota bacterium]